MKITKSLYSFLIFFSMLAVSMVATAPLNEQSTLKPEEPDSASPLVSLESSFRTPSYNGKLTWSPPCRAKGLSYTAYYAMWILSELLGPSGIGILRGTHTLGPLLGDFTCAIAKVINLPGHAALGNGAIMTGLGGSDGLLGGPRFGTNWGLLSFLGLGTPLGLAFLGLI